MADEFEQAVLLAFDQTGGADPALKARAAAALAAAAAAPDGSWALCLAHARSSAHAEVQFWCLQALHAAVAQKYDALPPAASAELRAGLLALGLRGAPGAGGGAPQEQPPLPAYLRNKVAQALVALAAREFPAAWPSFFDDLLAALDAPGGPPAADLLCRVLAAVDDDIVSLDVPRSAAGAAAAAAFKDAMRERALPALAAGWARLLAAGLAGGRAAAPAAAQALRAVGRYVHWVDIALVANAEFMPLLFAAVGAPEPEVAAAAADVLAEVVAKRMEPAAKLALVQQLGVAPVCARWDDALWRRARDGGDGELAGRFARLLAALAGEVLDAWKKVENPIISMAAVGLDVPADAAAEAGALCAAAAGLLGQLLPALVAALRCGGPEAAAAAAPPLQAHVARLKARLKRAGAGAALDAGDEATLAAVLEAAAVAARFPDDSAALPGAAAAAAPEERAAAEEEEAAVADARQELFTLFRNASALAPAAAVRLVGGRLATTLGAGAAAGGSWQDAELALSLLYQLGEGAPEEALRPGTGAVAALAAGVMEATAPAAAAAGAGGAAGGGLPPALRHRLAATALLETYARFWRLLPGAPTLLPAVVGAFLGGAGLGHESEAAARRAAYLFSRLARHLRPQLRAAAPALLARLQPHLAAVAATPAAEAPGGAAGRAAAAAAVHGAGAGGGLGGGPAVAAAPDDRLYAFEAAGTLLGGEDLPPDEQARWLAALLGPLVAQVEANLGAAEAAEAAAAAGQPPSPQQPAPAALVMQALDATTRLSKGLSARLCTEARPELGRLLSAALGSAAAAPARLPRHAGVRGRFISLLHRMVESLGPAVLPRLPAALDALLGGAGAGAAGAPPAALADVLALLNQLLARFRGDLAPLVAAVLPAVVGRVHAALGPGWDWTGGGRKAAAAPGAAAAAAATEEAREAAALQRAYYSFLLALAQAGLAGAVATAPGVADAATGALLEGAAAHADPAVRRTCVQALARLADDWLPPPAAAGPPAAGANGSGSPAEAAQHAQQQAEGPELVPGFAAWAVERFAGEALVGGLAAGVDARDAAALALLAEAAAALVLLGARRGPALAAHVRGVAAPRAGWAPEAAEQLLALVAAGDARGLKALLKSALQQQAAAAKARRAAEGGMR